MKYIIILILTANVILLKSCVFNNCEKLDISKDELTWFNCYKKGQTIFFKNQFDDFDTMIVFSNKLSYSQCNKFELGKYQFQTASIRLNQYNNNDLRENSRVQVNFTREKNNQLSSKSFYVFDYSIWDISNLKSELRDTTMYLTNGYNKKVKCIVFEEKNDNSHDSSNDDLNSFYWSKEMGLVKYIIHDSLIYELYKKDVHDH